MHETYQMVGCIDFETDSYAISIPVLHKERSNYIYIPETDHHFIVTDFYEIEELGHRVRYLPKKQPVTISKKTPVPIIEGDNVYLVDPDWSDVEIRSNHPQLGMEALKAFVSLRSRMAAKSAEIAHEEIGADIEDLLVDPVRSRYWISKFAALVRSAFESGQPSESLVRMMEDTRLKWLEKFSTKTSLKLVTQMMQIPNLTLEAKAAKRVLLNRFEGILSTKGIFAPRSELIAYEEMFPEGILPAIRADSEDQYDYWRRGGQIGKMVNDQMYALLNPADATQSRKYDPAAWSLAELDRFLRFFRVLGGDDHLLEQAASFFATVHEVLLVDLHSVLSLPNRYRWTSALAGRDVSLDFLRDLAQVTDKVPHENRPEGEDWMKIIDEVVGSFRKLTVLTKIVRPSLRARPDEEIAFKEFDHVLIDALLQAQRTRRLSGVASILKFHEPN